MVTCQVWKRIASLKIKANIYMFEKTQKVTVPGRSNGPYDPILIDLPRQFQNISPFDVRKIQ